MIYLDHNATTPIDERVLEAMLPFLKTYYGNPSSLYRHGRLVRSALDSAREQVAALVGVQSGQVIFTSGGTEANNLALAVLSPRAKFSISAIEHPSITEPADYWVRQGCERQIIRVNQHGLISQEAITDSIDFNPELVSIMLANNETGAIQDIATYSQQLKDHGILVHTDAVQALGKIPVEYDQLGVSMMSLSSHKIYGPKGCGALIYSKGVNLKPIIWGGDQEQAFRAGTENVPAIIGFGKAAELAARELTQRADHLYKLRMVLEQGLSTISGVKIFATQAERLSNTVQFGVDGMDGEMLLMKLDQKGIAVSSGSACASGGGKPSPVLAAMGVPEELAKSAIRVSLGNVNTEAEISQFINVLATLVTPDKRT